MILSDNIVLIDPDKYRKDIAFDTDVLLDINRMALYYGFMDLLKNALKSYEDGRLNTLDNLRKVDMLFSRYTSPYSLEIKLRNYTNLVDAFQR